MLKKEQEYKILLHELKNYLTISHGYLEILEREYTSNYISIIKKELNNCLKLIYDYNNTLRIEEIDLSRLLKDVQDILFDYYLHSNCKIKLEVEPELYIEGDYNRLKQVLINILKNSLEAHAKEISIIIKQRKNDYQIVIIDDGEGFSEYNLKRIGKELFTTKEKGTGIGLTYCIETIEQHKGKIKIQSKINIGTKVIITLPKKVRRLS